MSRKLSFQFPVALLKAKAMSMGKSMGKSILKEAKKVGAEAAKSVKSEIKATATKHLEKL